MKDYDAEITKLEANLKALKEAKAQEMEIQKQAAKEISLGINYLRQGFARFMEPDDIEFLTNFLFNKNIVDLCYNLVELHNDSIMGPLLNTLLDRKNPSNIITKDFSNEDIPQEAIETIIQDFLAEIGV